jgi:tungstate transport system substrate-binding protein
VAAAAIVRFDDLGQDSVLDRILPAFTQAPGLVRVIAQGGRALRNSAAGDVDVVLVHDGPRRTIGEGFGIDRRQIAWNIFVIVGPEDRARCSAAFKAIAAASTLYPRGDKSGATLWSWLWKPADRQGGAGTWYRDIGSGMVRSMPPLPWRPTHLRPRNLVEF